MHRRRLSSGGRQADVLAGGHPARHCLGVLSAVVAEIEASRPRRIPSEGGAPAGRRLLEELLKIF